MKNISFSMTIAQIEARTKDVTRRIGWKNVKPGQLLQAVKKAQGLKKGESVENLKVIRVIKATQEPLYHIDQADCLREGFPNMHPDEFVTMFCAANRCEKHTIVTRIEFEYVQPTRSVNA